MYLYSNTNEHKDRLPLIGSKKHYGPLINARKTDKTLDNEFEKALKKDRNHLFAPNPGLQPLNELFNKPVVAQIPAQSNVKSKRDELWEVRRKRRLDQMHKDYAAYKWSQIWRKTSSPQGRTTLTPFKI